MKSFEELLDGGGSIRDLDLDAFADGIVAHRDGKAFHENPDGVKMTTRRFSWAMGWNERALQQRD